MRLKGAFDALESKSVQGCINKANEQLNKLHQDLEILDNVEEEDDDSDDSTASGFDDDSESDAE